MRLWPKRDDPYRWRVPGHKAHLFQQSLSKLSTGVCIQIIDGIDKHFEAIAPDLLESPEQQASSLSVADLREQIATWKCHAEAEHASKAGTEMELAQTRDKLFELEQKYAKLESRFKRSAAVIYKMRARMEAFQKGYEQIEHIVGRVKHLPIAC